MFFLDITVATVIFVSYFRWKRGRKQKKKIKTTVTGMYRFIPVIPVCTGPVQSGMTGMNQYTGNFGDWERRGVPAVYTGTVALENRYIPPVRTGTGRDFKP